MSAEEKFEKFLVGPHLHPGTEYLRSKQLFFAGHASRDEEVNKLRALCLELAEACEAIASGSVYHDNGPEKTPKTRCRNALYGHKNAIEKLRGGE